MTPSITICIPTHGRAELLGEAVASALNQSLPATEIIVSDDCGDPTVKNLVEQMGSGSPTRVRYIHCTDGPGQAANVNRCFKAVSTDLLVLLHDDDLLLPDALRVLIQPFLERPDLLASYGCQQVVDADGSPLTAMTERITGEYFRTKEWEGLQKSSFCAAVRGQFPNNGYLLRASVAQKVGYDPTARDAVDIDFGIRCAPYGSFYFINQPVSKYRLSVDSVVRGAGARTDTSAYIFTTRLEKLQAPDAESRQAMADRLKAMMPAAIAQAAQLGHVESAWRWYFSAAHGAQIFSLGGIRRLFILLQASLQKLVARS